MNAKKRFLVSLTTIGAVAAIAIAATGAFFSDTETSEGNTFIAGALDLKIDNESYAIDCTIKDEQGNLPVECEGVLAFSPFTSWELTDLTEELFFDFADLKPGDFGEDTISIHVDNDAWLCMDWRTDTTPENERLDPEIEDGDETDEEGELQNFIEFVWWVDDGDNVLEDDEDEGVLFTGTLEEMNELSVALADSSIDSVTGGVPIPGSEEDIFYIGKAWCFGDLVLAPVDSDGVGADDPPTAERGPGILCDGEPVDNTPQTDEVHGTMTFSAEQSRHNPDFLCNLEPTSTPEPTVSPEPSATPE